jgi:hypothetical protein
MPSRKPRVRWFSRPRRLSVVFRYWTRTMPRSLSRGMGADRYRVRLLLAAVRARVMLSSFRRVVGGVRVMSVCHERVVPRFLVIPCLVVLRSLAVVPRSALVVVSGRAMVVGAVVVCHIPSRDWVTDPAVNWL